MFGGKEVHSYYDSIESGNSWHNYSFSIISRYRDRSIALNHYYTKDLKNLYTFWSGENADFHTVN